MEDRPMRSSLRGFLIRRGFEMGPVIGEGSFSKVRIGIHNGNRHVALKIVSKNSMTQVEAEKFLPREIAIVRKLSHVNVIEVYNILYWENRVIFVMELAKRGDLLKLLQEKGPLKERVAKNYFRQLVGAIKYLHDKQMCHRDLKCENILISEGNIIKLGDFGFSRVCTDPQTGKRVLSQTYCGTLAYTPPEILLGSPYNPKMSDLWSLGCVLFIMITAKFPFDGANLGQVIRQQLKRRIRFPTETQLNTSKECRVLIRQMLEPDVSRRIILARVMQSHWFSSPDQNEEFQSLEDSKAS